MKLLNLVFTLFSITCFSQASFYSATLIDNNDVKKTIFLKNWHPILNSDGSITIYESSNIESETILRADDFKNIYTEDLNLQFETAIIEGLNVKDKVILRKLVQGSSSLFSYLNLDRNLIYLNQTNNTYTVLHQSKKGPESQVSYKQWLFENLNPQNKDAKEFAKLSYSTSSLTDYYVNSIANSRELAQAPKPKLFNMGVQLGYVNHNFNTELEQLETSHENLSTSSIRLGIRGYINVDPTYNRLTIFTGLDYFSRAEGTSTGVLFPNSRITRRDAVTSASIQYWSVSAGIQYNIHLERLTLSPFFSLESVQLSSEKNQSFKISDDRVIYDIDSFNTSLISINLGAKTSLYKSIYGSFELSYMTQLQGQNDETARPSNIRTDIFRLSLSVGYELF